MMVHKLTEGIIPPERCSKSLIWQMVKSNLIKHFRWFHLSSSLCNKIEAAENFSKELSTRRFILETCCLRAKLRTITLRTMCIAVKISHLRCLKDLKESKEWAFLIKVSLKWIARLIQRLARNLEVKFLKIWPRKFRIMAQPLMARKE